MTELSEGLLCHGNRVDFTAHQRLDRCPPLVTPLSSASKHRDGHEGQSQPQLSRYFGPRPPSIDATNCTNYFIFSTGPRKYTYVKGKSRISEIIFYFAQMSKENRRKRKRFRISANSKFETASVSKPERKNISLSEVLKAAQCQLSALIKLSSATKESAESRTRSIVVRTRR